jgi:hypothetical protein
MLLQIAVQDIGQLTDIERGPPPARGVGSHQARSAEFRTLTLN